MNTVEQLEIQLTSALRDLAGLTAARDVIVKREKDQHWTATDSAVGSGIRRKPNAKADTARFNRYDREAQVFADYDTACERARILERRLNAARAEVARVPYTRDDLINAVIVKDRYGWHKVLYMNQLTVTVDSEYGARRIPFSRVLDYREATK